MGPQWAGAIIGHKGSQHRHLQELYGVKIVVHQKEGHLTVEGAPRLVDAAIAAVHKIIEEAKESSGKDKTNRPRSGVQHHVHKREGFSVDIKSLQLTYKPRKKNKEGKGR